MAIHTEIPPGSDDLNCQWSSTLVGELQPELHHQMQTEPETTEEGNACSTLRLPPFLNGDIMQEESVTLTIHAVVHVHTCIVNTAVLHKYMNTALRLNSTCLELTQAVRTLNMNQRMNNGSKRGPEYKSQTTCENGEVGSSQCHCHHSFHHATSSVISNWVQVHCSYLLCTVTKYQELLHSVLLSLTSLFAYRHWHTWHDVSDDDEHLQEITTSYS